MRDNMISQGVRNQQNEEFAFTFHNQTKLSKSPNNDHASLSFNNKLQPESRAANNEISTAKASDNIQNEPNPYTDISLNDKL